MLECDIDDVAIEIIDETKEQNTQESTVTTPVFPRRSSTTAMDIYSEIRTKREEELLEMIEKKSSQIVELEIKIVKLENDMKQITERDQETSKKKRKLRETCDEDDKVNENLQQQVENLMNRLGERESELHDVREKLAEREWKESDEIKRLEKEVKQLKQRENKDTINTEVKALQKVIETKDKDLQNLKRSNEKLLNTEPIGTETSQTNEINCGNGTLQLVKLIEEKMTVGFNAIQVNMESIIKDKLSKLSNPDVAMEDTSNQSTINEHKSYAGVASQKSTPDNFRSIMLATKNEERAEESEKKRRSKNLIVHGKEEQTPEEDKTFVNEMLKELQIGAINTKLIERIGTVDNNKGRPIKLVFHNEEDQQKVFLNLRNLKGKNLYNKISIREDYTFTERSLVKSFIEQAKLKNQEEEGRNSNIIWRVRGTPKNGLTLKKFTRNQKEINPPQN